MGVMVVVRGTVRAKGGGEVEEAQLNMELGGRAGGRWGWYYWAWIAHLTGFVFVAYTSLIVVSRIWHSWIPSEARNVALLNLWQRLVPLGP